MKDLIFLIVFLFSIRTLIENGSITAFCLSVFILIMYTIKYTRQKYALENFSKINKHLLNKQKDFFMNILIHDFKVPIIAQMRGLELLQNGILGSVNEEQKDILSQINGSCKYVLDMISMFSNAYMFEKNSYKLIYEKFSLSELITSCLDEVAIKAKEKKIKFAFTTTQQDTQINADKNEIRKVILNLLMNAINYSNEDDRIDVKLQSDYKNVNFTISGMGLVYGKNTYTKEENRYTTIGHTLGMYLSKKIIEIHKGKISWTGENMNCFKFTLPLLNGC